MWRRWLLRCNQHARVLLMFTVLFTVLLLRQGGSQLLDADGQLRIDSTIEPFISRDSDVYEEFLRSRDLFGSEEVLIIALQAQPAQPVGLAQLEVLDQLQQRLRERLPGVSSVQSVLDLPRPFGECAGKSYFHREQAGSVCVSTLEQLQDDLACLRNPPAAPSPPADVDFSLEEDPLGDPPDASSLEAELVATLLLDLDPTEVPDFEDAAPPTQRCAPTVFAQTAEELRRRANEQIQQTLQSLTAQPLARGDLISQDGATLALVVQFSADTLPSAEETQLELQQILAGFASPELRLAYAGQSRQVFAASQVLQRDIERILPLSGGLIVLVLFATFRTWQAVFIALTNVLLSLFWTASFIGAFGAGLNLVTIAFAPILICVGSAYVIKVLDHFLHVSRAHPAQSLEARISSTLESVTLPVSITALTTVAGFAALTVSPIPAIQQLGVYSCVGVLLSNLFALTVALAWLRVLRVPAPPPKTQRLRRSTHFWEQRSEWLRQHARQVIGVWLLLATLAGVGVFSVRIDSSAQNLSPEHPLEQDLRLIEEHLAGVSSLRLMFSVSPAAATPLVSAKTLLGLQQFERWLFDGQSVEVQSLEGLRLDKVYSPSQTLAVYRNGLDDLSDAEVRRFFERLQQEQGAVFLSEDGSTLQMTLRFRTTSSTILLEWREILQQNLPRFVPHLQTRFTGGAVLTSESANNIATGQARSVALALLIIFGMMWGLFLSWKMGVIALFPNIAAVLLFFGTLGWFGLPLGVTISIIASIALGIGVDDTIHFLSRYHQNVQQTRDRRQASTLALRQVARPMLATTCALALGFSVFTTSEMDSQVLFGLLTAFTLLVCLATDMTFLPTIVMETGLITVWDYLGLRFDESFVRRVGLFRGLSVKEAKVATLLAYSETLRDQQVLFRRGDQGNEMYVILSGEIRIVQRHEGRERQLAQLPVGATFGEMGLFRVASRSATAIAVGPTRLLVINRDSLDNLMRRRPFIATTLFLNLARQLRAAIQQTSGRILDQVTHTVAEGPHLTPHPRQGLVDIFQGMSANDQQRLAQCGDVRAISTGEKVFERGEHGHELLILLEGELEVRMGEAREGFVIAISTPYDLLGESALLEDQPTRTADVIARQPSRALFLHHAQLEQLRQSDSRLAAHFTFNLVCLLSDRLENTNAQLE
jgi:predicted RND superfamily exporter protein/CRP-like cAMP-binding protein